jgi:hypothetical protein
MQTAEEAPTRPGAPVDSAASSELKVDEEFAEYDSADCHDLIDEEDEEDEITQPRRTTWRRGASSVGGLEAPSTTLHAAGSVYLYLPLHDQHF